MCYDGFCVEANLPDVSEMLLILLISLRVQLLGCCTIDWCCLTYVRDSHRLWPRLQMLFLITTRYYTIVVLIFRGSPVGICALCRSLGGHLRTVGGMGGYDLGAGYVWVCVCVCIFLHFSFFHKDNSSVGSLARFFCFSTQHRVSSIENELQYVYVYDKLWKYFPPDFWNLTEGTT